MTEQDATRARLREIVGRAPNVTGAQLARELGVSRQRISQLMKSEGLSLAPWTIEQHREAGTRHPAARVRTGGVAVKISATVAGTIGEMLAAADLMARGFMVFFPLTRTGMCDIISLDKAGRCERIEVRCGKLSADGGRVVWQTADTSKSDRRAIVMTGEPVRYSPQFEGDTE